MVDVYITDTGQWEEEALYHQWLEIVPEERKKRAESCRRMEDKRRSLAGTILACSAIADRYAGGSCNADEVIDRRQNAYCRIGNCHTLNRRVIQSVNCEFAYSQTGKPYLTGNHGFFFNISHSGNYAVCAAAGQEVGVDIQQVRDVKADIAARFFSEEERAQIEAEGAGRELMLFRIWSAKESFIKLTGRGLQDLSTFTVDLRNNCIKRHDMQKTCPVYLKEYEVPDGYVLTVCSYEKDFGELKVYTVT